MRCYVHICVAMGLHCRIVNKQRALDRADTIDYVACRNKIQWRIVLSTSAIESEASMQLVGNLEANAVPGRAVNLHANSTVRDVVEYWLQARRGEVKKNTWKSYHQQATLYIIGPLLAGSKLQRYKFAWKGARPNDAPLIDMLGPVSLQELTTAQIRQWHRTLCTNVSGYTAKVAKKHLRSALALVAEDFDLHVPMMPSASRARRDAS